MNKTLLKDYQVLTVTGENACKFLQGQITIDVSTLSTGSATLAAHCNPKGRIIANFIIASVDATHYYLITPQSVADKLQTTLQKYAQFSKVTVAISPQQVALATANSIATTTLNFALAYPDINIAIDATTDDTDENWPAILIQHGIVMIDANTSEQFTPHAIGFELHGGVDFKKGCYTGQEIIARMHFRGKPKDGLYLANYSAKQRPETYSSILDAEENHVGRLLAIADGQVLINLRHDAVTKTLFLNKQPLTAITQHSKPS